MEAEGLLFTASGQKTIDIASSDEHTVAVAKDSDGWTEWADVLGSALGGGVLAILVWFGLKQPCEIGSSGLFIDCVRAAGMEVSMAEIAFWVPVIAAGVGLLIHVARS